MSRSEYYKSRRAAIGYIRKIRSNLDEEGESLSHSSEARVEHLQGTCRPNDQNVESNDASSDSEIISNVESNVSDMISDQLSFCIDGSTSPVGLLSDKSAVIESNNSEKSLKGALQSWAIETGATHNSINNLLRKLKPFHPNLPLDARSLLGREEIHAQHFNLDNGEFIYYGVKPTLERFLFQNEMNDSGTVRLFFNIDGIPLTDSGDKEFWPILGMLEGKQPLIIGLFCGTGKPVPVKKFLDPLVEDIILLKSSNEIMVGDKSLTINVAGIICDAPARSFIKGTISHNGQYACDRCHVKGEQHEHTMTYIRTNESRRTVQEFIQFIDADEDEKLAMDESIVKHIRSPTSLVHALDVVEDLPLDYMHLVCLGVIRRMLVFLTSKIPVKLSRNSRTTINASIEQTAKNSPIEVTRKPRTLNHLDKFKAVEFRFFLLYIGPIVLKGSMPTEQYQHFLLLHTSMKILCSDKVSHEELEEVNGYLEAFVQHCSKFYGRRFITYNVHSVIHLPDDYIRFGNIESVSAFPFESHLGFIKRYLRSPNRPLAQVRNRIHEQIPLIKTNRPTGERSGIRLSRFDRSTEKYYKICLPNNCSLSSDRNNRTFVGKDRITYIFNSAEKEENDVYIFCHQVLTIDDFFTYPKPSRMIKIYLLKRISSEVTKISARDILKKCAVFETKWGSVCCEMSKNCF